MIPLALVGPGREMVGRVNLSTYRAVVAETRLAGVVYVVRKDQSGGASFTDLSADAADAATTFLIWGAAVADGDVVYIACDNPIRRIHIEIVTPGVWAGTGLGIRYSSNGSFADKTLSGTTDNTNGFRAAAAIRTIEVVWPSDIVTFSPLPGSAADITAGHAVASRRWLGLFPQGITGSTTAPVIRRIWLEHTDVTNLDLTTISNVDLTPAPAEGTTQFFPTADTSVYYCTEFPSRGERRYLYKAQAANRTRVQEYLASDDTWKTLPSVTDPSTDFTEPPAVYQTTPVEYELSWSRPADWASKTKTFGTVTATGYWRRIRTTAITTPGLMGPVTAIVRARQYGPANTSGMRVTAAQVLRGLTLHLRGAISGTGAVGLELEDLGTGDTRAVAVSASAVSGDYIPVDVPDLSLAAGSQWGMRYVSGTREFADFLIDIEK